MQLLTPVRPPAAKVEPFARLRGAVYPFAPHPTTHIEELTPVGSGDPLADQLTASIASKLRTPFLESTTRDARVEAYVADVGVLGRVTDEATRFLRQIVEHYLSGTPDPAVRSVRVAELMHGMPSMALPPNLLSAEFLARPAAEVGRDLSNAVSQTVAQLVITFMSSLRTLTNRCVCGLIDRPNDEVCRFTYFDEVLTQRTTKSQKRKRKKAGTPQEQPGQLLIGIDTVTTWETTTTDRRFTKHEHHLMNTTEVAPGFTRWLLPTQVEYLIASAPTWVRPLLRIVEGTVVVERSITWESSKSATRVIDERDELVYAPDPALVLGDFVLAGWGEDELRAITRSGSAPADRSSRTTPTRTNLVRGAWTVGAVVAALVSCRLSALAVSESSVFLGILVALCAGSAACFARTASRSEFVRSTTSSPGVSS